MEIIIILITLLIIIIGVLIYKKFNSIKEDFTYYKCNKYQVGHILTNVFNKNNITKENDINKSDIYIPCGYNFVEKELTTLKPKNKNQIIFGISGCDQIVSKNRLWEIIKDYYGRNTAKKIMPETWILTDNQEMKSFISQYNPNQIYILKKNVQRKEGLKLTKNLEEILRAKNENYRVVQKYHQDLYLINNRKVNLRIYLLVVCQNGKVQCYLHKLGKCIYTNKEYNDDDFDFESNITSYHLDMNVYQKNPYSFTQLRQYLKDNNKDDDKLFKEIDQIIYMTMKASQSNLCKLPNVYQNKTFQLFGLDIIFDKNMKPYLLEMNKGPDMLPRDETDEKMKYKVEKDIFDTVGMIDNNNIDNVNHDNEFYRIL